MCAAVIYTEVEKVKSTDSQEWEMAPIRPGRLAREMSFDFADSDLGRGEHPYLQRGEWNWAASDPNQLDFKRENKSVKVKEEMTFRGGRRRKKNFLFLLTGQQTVQDQKAGLSGCEVRGKSPLMGHITRPLFASIYEKGNAENFVIRVSQKTFPLESRLIAPPFC